MMERLFNQLLPLLRKMIRAPATVLAASLLAAVAGLLLALNLRIDNDLSKLIPQSYPSVQALNTLREQVGGENEMAVAIRSPSFEANKRFAERLIPPALQLEDSENGNFIFTRAEFRKDVDFLKTNALYFATGQELDLLREYLETIIREAREEANPFYFELEEEPSPADSMSQELEELYDELIGSEYPISPDSSLMVVKFFPSGAQTDLEFIEHAYTRMQTLVDSLEPGPQMEVVLAGRMMLTLIEVQSITRDVKESFGAGAAMLMMFVLGYFFYKGYRSRSPNGFSLRLLGIQATQLPAHILIMGLPLAISMCWTFGVAWLAFGTLNIMTSTLGLLLFGMGIDFGIHFFGRYSEERRNGFSVDEAVVTTFMTTGQAVFAVGLTTAAAFFILMLADFKGFSEFGFIAGTGLLFAIITYIFFLPALLVLLERSPLLDISNSRPATSTAANRFPTTSTPSYRRKLLPSLVIGVTLVLSILSIIRLPGLQFEYDFGRLEPTYEEYVERSQLVREVYSDRRTRNAAYIITDQPFDAPQVADILRNRAARDTLSPTTREVETFQDRYPIKPENAFKKLQRIADLRSLLKSPFLQGSDAEDLDLLRTAAQTRAPIPMDSVPDFLIKPFTSVTGQIGNLVIVYPSVGLSDGRNSMKFADDVGEVRLDNGKIYHAGSTSIVASDMLRLMTTEAPVMIALTIAFIIILKLIILRGVKWMLLALLPLIAGFLWLFGLMETIGWKLNFYNLVVLPTILGIGDDSGIHIVHRYQEEGRGSLRTVLSSTGEHITISALTTMLGFGGLLITNHPGMKSIGEVAILGIGLSLFAALFLLPVLLKLLERKHHFDEMPHHSQTRQNV